MDVVNKLAQGVNSGLDYLNSNRILSTILGLFLVLYAALAAPKLPKSISSWFDNVWFKLGFMFLIAYMATRDPSVAIISAIALLVTLQTLSAQKTAETVVKSVQAKIEKFTENKQMKHEENVKVSNDKEEEEEEENDVKPSDMHAKNEELVSEKEDQTEQEHTEQEHTEQTKDKSSCNAPENLIGYDGNELAAI
jgi:hypothetical protein